AGGVRAGSAGQAIAGMGARAAKEEAADGRFVTRPIEDGAHGEKLIEREFAVENVAASETVGRFEILGRDDLHAFDEAWKIRGVGGERSNDGGAKFPAAGVPISFPEFVWCILNAGGEDMFAFRRQFRIEDRRNGEVEIWLGRDFAIFGGVEGTLEIIDVRTDVDAAGERFEKTLGGIE